MPKCKPKRSGGYIRSIMPCVARIAHIVVVRTSSHSPDLSCCCCHAVAGTLVRGWCLYMLVSCPFHFTCLRAPVQCMRAYAHKGRQAGRHVKRVISETHPRSLVDRYDARWTAALHSQEPWLDPLPCHPSLLCATGCLCIPTPTCFCCIFFPFFSEKE